MNIWNEADRTAGIYWLRLHRQLLDRHCIGITIKDSEIHLTINDLQHVMEVTSCVLVADTGYNGKTSSASLIGTG